MRYFLLISDPNNFDLSGALKDPQCHEVAYKIGNLRKPPDIGDRGLFWVCGKGIFGSWLCISPAAIRPFPPQSVQYYKNNYMIENSNHKRVVVCGKALATPVYLRNLKSSIGVCLNQSCAPLTGIQYETILERIGIRKPVTDFVI